MNVASLIRSRWLPLMLATTLALVAAEAGAQLSAKPGKYGKTLVMDVVLSPSEIDKYAAFLQDLAATNKGVANSVMSGPTADWQGASMLAVPRQSPYTMVVSVEGTTQAAGDVVTTWSSGWRLEDNSTRTSLMHGLSAFGVSAGERVTLTAATAPSRFDRDKTVTPLLSLIEARNIRIEHVQVQLWSGMGGITPMQWFTSYPFVWFGVVMLAVTLIFRKI
jgi:hypothetical protein